MNRPRKRVLYQDDNFQQREGEVVEKNGNLILIEDKETGEETYRCPFEIEGEIQ